MSAENMANQSYAKLTSILGIASYLASGLEKYSQLNLDQKEANELIFLLKFGDHRNMSLLFL